LAVLTNGGVLSQNYSVSLLLLRVVRKSSHVQVWAYLRLARTSYCKVGSLDLWC